MLLALRDEAGRISVAVDYYLVNDEGKIIFDGNGTHLWMERFEVSSGEDGKQIMKRAIQTIAECIPFAEDAYWVRKEKSETKIHHFSRRQLLAYANKLKEVSSPHVET